VIDAQGWFHTGDIARILPSSALQIIDRKKSIFKLQQGEYIEPERVSIQSTFHLYSIQIEALYK